MPYFKKEVGDLGESLSVKLLNKSGYRIIAKNLVTKIGEIDILAIAPKSYSRFNETKSLLFKKRAQSDIVVVEVKAKSGRGFGEGFEMINFRKRAKLLALAKLIQVEYPDRTIRIDIISVDTSQDPPEIKHFKSAVEENNL